MMKQLALLAALALAGCTGQITDTARMPATAYGTPVLTDQGALELVDYYLTDPALTRGNPALGAQTVAAVDYLAGELDTDPRWIGMPLGARLQMLQGRSEVRRALLIPESAPSQEVVNRLFSAATAFQNGNQPAAIGSLTSPVFGLGAAATAERLAALPYFPVANAAAHRAFISQDQQHNRGCQLLPCS